MHILVGAHLQWRFFSLLYDLPLLGSFLMPPREYSNPRVDRDLCGGSAWPKEAFVKKERRAFRSTLCCTLVSSTWQRRPASACTYSTARHFLQTSPVQPLQSDSALLPSQYSYIGNYQLHLRLLAALRAIETAAGMSSAPEKVSGASISALPEC